MVESEVVHTEQTGDRRITQYFTSPPQVVENPIVVLWPAFRLPHVCVSQLWAVLELPPLGLSTQALQFLSSSDREIPLLPPAAAMARPCHCSYRLSFNL